MTKAFKNISVLLVGSILLLVGLFLWLKPAAPFSSLPSITETSSRHAGDPITIGLLGNREEISKAFLAAHWRIPDPISATSTAHITTASITDSSYPAAPVSDLYLFGRTQDLSFELPTNTVRERHHIRLWETTISLSGKTLWLGAASYDSGIELSGTTALPTHHIAPNVDAERNFVTASLQGTGLVQGVSTERISYPTLWGSNGGGDWYFDDGLLNLVLLQ
ncbi:MAG: LssY C-terminal domain-containing protein [Minisyncoccota bacterium]